ncbi:MAG TPA: DUF488 domain-containing protein [Gemmatimonadales bacterium]|jgi:uncharacterized protein (DUF488 family)
MASDEPEVWTVGHSTRSLDAFLALLQAHEIQAVADVRRYPGSRRWPHFAGPALSASLASQDIDYLWLPQLGGRRQPLPNSHNTSWRSASFRGYADHMETETFATGLQALQSLIHGQRTAVMCAEALWWRCHRALISDVLYWLGYRVYHIQSLTSTEPHPYSSAASIVGGRLSYGPP